MDQDGNARACALTGDPGFIRATGTQTVAINAYPRPHDPLAQQPNGSPAGFLAIDLATRQRFRFNGTVTNTNNTLRFNDYPGNNMFQTLGNLTADPPAGLLFIDFKTGTTLQLTGRAAIDWMPTRHGDRFHTGRSVTFTPQRAVRIPHALPLRWVLRAYSPFNTG